MKVVSFFRFLQNIFAELVLARLHRSKLDKKQKLHCQYREVFNAVRITVNIWKWYITQNPPDDFSTIPYFLHGKKLETKKKLKRSTHPKIMLLPNFRGRNIIALLNQNLITKSTSVSWNYCSDSSLMSWQIQLEQILTISLSNLRFEL